MSKYQRDKGAAGEREVSAILSEALGYLIQRKLSASRDGGDDIQIGKFRLEIKRQEITKPDAWMAQAEENANDGEIPVVVYRRSRQPWRCIMRMDDFIGFLKL